MSEERDLRLAVLIDADNASHNSLEAVLTVLAEVGPVNIRRAYGNWRKEALKGWEANVMDVHPSRFISK